MVSGGKADCQPIRKEKSESGRLWGAGKTVRTKMNGVGGKRTADGSAKKRAKIRGVATQWAPEGNEWRIQTHQAYEASRADTGRPDADTIRRTHTFFFADICCSARLEAAFFLGCAFSFPLSFSLAQFLAICPLPPQVK